MTYPQIDTRGRSCPEPVLLTRKGVEKSPEGVMVLVDNTTARDNVTRFARNSGYQVQTEQDGTDYRVTLTR